MGNKELIYIDDIVYDITTRNDCHNCVISGESDVKRSQFIDYLICLFGNSDEVYSDQGFSSHQIAQLKSDLDRVNIHLFKVEFQEHDPHSLTDGLLKALGMESQSGNSLFVLDIIEQCVDSILCKSEHERIVIVIDDIQRFCKSEVELLQLQMIIVRFIHKVYFICINHQCIGDFYGQNNTYFDILSKILWHSHDFRHIDLYD